MTLVSTNQDFEKENESPSVNKNVFWFSYQKPRIRCSQIHSSSLRPGMKWHGQDLPQDFHKRFCIPLTERMLTSLSSSGGQVWAFLWERQRALSPCPHCICVGPFSSLYLMWIDRYSYPASPDSFKNFFLICIFQEIIEFSLFHLAFYCSSFTVFQVE